MSAPTASATKIAPPTTIRRYHCQFADLSRLRSHLPPSAEPTTFIFLFKRNGWSYLTLTTTLAAQAMSFSNSYKFGVGVSSFSAILGAT